MRFLAKFRFPMFDLEGGEGGGGGDAGAGAGGDGGAGAADAGAGAGTDTGAGAGSGAGAAQAGRSTDAAIAAARARIAEGKKGLEGPTGDPKAGASQTTGDAGGGAGAEGAAQAGAEGADGAAGDGKDGEGDEKKFEVSLPSGRDGEEDLPIEVSDQEVHDRINRLVNRAQVAAQLEEAHGAVVAQAQELSEVEDAIAVDPVGFVLDKMPAEHQIDIARQLIMGSPAVFKALSKELGEALDDPALRDRHQLTAENSRLKMKETLRNSLVERKEMEANGRKVVAELNRLIPKTITGEKRESLFNDAIRDIKDIAKRMGMKQMPIEDIPLAVARRFREAGIDLRAAVAGNGGAPGGQPQSQAQPGAKAGEGEKTGQDFKAGADARRAAAAAAPAGVGAPASRARPQLPASKHDGKDTDRAVAELRKGGIRRALGKT